MKICVLLLFLLALAELARADLMTVNAGFPTYKYFYACDAGLVDCGAFPRHYYGDFGFNGPQQILINGEWFEIDNFHVRASNDQGMVIGDFAALGRGVLYGSTVGIDSTLRVAYWSGSLGDSRAIDINNNGTCLFVWGRAGYMPFNFGCGGSDFALWYYVDRLSIATQLGAEQFGQSWFEGSPAFFVAASGINDYDQILVDVAIRKDGNWQGVRGVLSPTAIPEPSSGVLLIAVIALTGGMATLRRKNGPPWLPL